MESVNSEMNSSEQQPMCEKQRAKISEVRASLGPVPDKLFYFCSNESIARYLRARNWNVKKASKMLKETLKWRLEYKPEEIKWDDISNEAETGKIYRSNFGDKLGRSVLVMRPGCQNTKSIKGQIKYLVYCMENAILNLPPDQEQMVWLIDFQGFNMSHLSVKQTKETADVLQNQYPERLGIAILYNPPRIFESFFMVVKPFLESKTAKKVHFVYSDDPGSMKLMEEIFDINELDSAFGGKSQVGFSIDEYSARMRDDDTRMPSFWSRESTSSSEQITTTISNLNISNSKSDSNSTEKENENGSKSSILKCTSFENGVAHLDANGSCM